MRRNPSSTRAISLALTVAALTLTGGAEPGVRLVAFDVTVDGRRLGERFDLVVGVEQTPDEPPAQKSLLPP